MIEIPDRARRIVPRWLSPAEHARKPESRPTESEQGAVELPSRDLNRLVHDFAGDKSSLFAGDLASVALAIGRRAEGYEAAQVLLEDPAASTLAKHVAERLLTANVDGQLAMAVPASAGDQHSARDQIGSLRKRLRLVPRDALRWAELSRFHALLGDGDGAAGAMRVALALAPNDRYVLRSASRLYVHLGDPERAHHLLSRHRRTVSDPWLLAPQIGVADLGLTERRHHGHARHRPESRNLGGRHQRAGFDGIRVLDPEAQVLRRVLGRP